MKIGEIVYEVLGITVELKEPHSICVNNGIVLNKFGSEVITIFVKDENNQNHTIF